MNFSYLFKKSNDFRKKAEPTKFQFSEPPSSILGEKLLSYILSIIPQGSFKPEELDSFIRTNRTILSHIKSNVEWQGYNTKEWFIRKSK